MPELAIPGTVEAADGPPPTATLSWDPETEILTCGIPGLVGRRGLTGSIELEDATGAVVTLDFADGVLRGVDVVVWPPSRTVPGLAPPPISGHGRLAVPARPSQPGTAVVECDARLSVERGPDDRVLRLIVGAPRGRRRAIALADRLLLETDGDGAPCGFWFLDVPPFPAGERA